MLFEQAPGYWFGPVEQFPGVPALRRDLPTSEDVAYYQTVVQAETPSGYPHLGRELRSDGIQSPQVLAAVLDPNGRVYDIRPATLWDDATLDTTPAAALHQDESGVVGVVLPGPSYRVGLWSFGGAA